MPGDVPSFLPRILQSFNSYPPLSGQLLFLWFRHRSTSVFDGISKFSRRVAEYVISATIEDGYFISMSKRTLTAFVVKNNHEICSAQIVRYDNFRASLIQRLHDFCRLRASAA